MNIGNNFPETFTEFFHVCHKGFTFNLQNLYLLIIKQPILMCPNINGYNNTIDYITINGHNDGLIINSTKICKKIRHLFTNNNRDL